MPYQFPPDIERIVKAQMSAGDFGSEDDTLREALQALMDRQAVLADLRAGIADMDSGRGRPLEEVDVELRRTYGIAKEA